MTRGYYRMPSDQMFIWPERWDKPFYDSTFACSSYENCHVPWGNTHEESLLLIKKMILSAGNMYGLVSTISVNRLLMAGPHAVHILVLLIWLVSLKMYTISISRNGQINKSCIFSRIGTGPRDRMLICGVIIIRQMKWNCL